MPPKTAAETNFIDTILCGDALSRLREFPDELIDCIVTSPPYFQQRDYTNTRQVGQEQSPQQYVAALVEIFSEAQRVLKTTGTCWLVIGDKYRRGEQLGIPWRLALALKDEGWILRSDVIWHKPNAMPSSVKNRPTCDHEYVFLFTKSHRRYYYNADAIREPHVTFSADSKMRGGRRHFFQKGSTPEAGKNSGDSNLHDARWDQAFHPKGRNKRTVWSIPLSKFRDAHFAVFPETLAETAILAGCPDRGIVLDPFLGSGTTAITARRLGRHYVGIDCVEEYCDMARRRLSEKQYQSELFERTPDS